MKIKYIHQNLGWKWNAFYWTFPYFVISFYVQPTRWGLGVSTEAFKDLGIDVACFSLYINWAYEV